MTGVLRQTFTKIILFLGLLIFSFILQLSPASATTGINQQINFQGRLLNAQGATAPDGYYNIQFKIYKDGDGQSVGDTTGAPAGSLLWTESHINNTSQGVRVVNGYLSVQLGAITAFGSSVDWNQDTLWLSMNVGSTAPTCTPFTSCTPDGEMIPMKRLSASPYSLNSGLLGGIAATGFIQNTTTVQSANIAVQSSASGNIAALIQGAASQTADIFQVKANGVSTPLLTVSASGKVGIGNTATSGYALDVTGDINSSTQYRISGVTTLTNSALTFSGASTSNVQSTAGQSLNLSGSTSISLQTNGITRATLDNANNIYFGNGVTAAAPNSFDIFGTGSSTTAVAGGALTIQGGNATVGSANGGNVTVAGGTGIGTGANGLVVIATPTFSTTANDANCYTGGALVTASCTITASSVNNTSAVIVGFSTAAQTAILPDPTITTAGRIVYITAANTSVDFTLSVNGGGQGNTIAMRQNTSATMIWNGTDWTAAGASSSTTLQSAYDNTLQSAGGAELIVSKTGNTNGLTIRDSTIAPVNGTLLSVQTSSAAGLLSVNSNVTEYSTDSGAETAGSSGATSFPASTWSAVTGSTVTRYTTAGNYIATGQASTSVVTSTTAQSGVKDQLTGALVANTTYNVSFSSRLLSGSFTDLNVYYSVDGSTASVPCTATAAVNMSIWTKINCSFKAPASGILANNAILIRQTAAGTARTFYIDNISVTIAADYNYASDGGVDDSVNFATNWLPVNSAAVTRSTSVGNDTSDSAQVVTSAATLRGVRNSLSVRPLANTLYRVTAYAASTTAGFNSFYVRYSRDGGTTFTDCADYNTQAVSSSISSFTKITCYITTDSTAATSPYIYFVQNDAVARTFYVDTFSMTLSSNTTPNVQVGGGINGGPTTLFTLDRGASAPIASNNDALLGSMYYDTTLGKLQCYESDGWGACGSSPDSVITISPEYTNAVLHGTGVGTMTSDLCSSTLHINDGTSSQPTICGTNETYNFYRWTSPQALAQTYSIYVTYQLPTTFKSFASGQTTLMGRTDNGPTTGTGTVQYSIYKNNSSSGLTICGGVISVSTGTQTSWLAGKTIGVNGAADPSACGFAGGDSIIFKIDVIANRNANAYVGNLNFIFTNK